MKRQRALKSVVTSLITRLWIGAVMSLSTIASAADNELALSISQVQMDRQQFVPQQQQQLVINFQLSQAASVKLRWFDGRDILIREIQSPQVLPAGAHQLIWDGKDQAGRWVPDEVYHYSLQATDATGQELSYDLTDSSYGEEVQVSQVQWDALTKRIHYRLSQSARVNIRAGLNRNGPLLRTISDWLPRLAGDHREAWDGWDESGVLNIAAHPQLDITVNAFSLGTNAVIVGAPQSIQLIENMTWPEVQRVSTVQHRKRMYFHAQQALTERGDIKIKLSLPDSWPTDASGHAVVSGIVPVRLEVADGDRQRALDRRFEPVFFIDGSFAFENEVGYLPTTWLWDTRNTEPGQHLINANLRGYEGNFGMASLPVTIVTEKAND